jgi:hypothetical protein
MSLFRSLNQLLTTKSVHCMEANEAFSGNESPEDEF